MDEVPARVHPLTQGFQRTADVYERARPGYAAEAIRALAEALHIGPGTRLVDIGAGTGKLTRELLPTGAHITAVEPLAGMREQFRQALPEIEVLDGTAEHLPLQDGEIDVLVAGQAWHWFDGEATLREAGRVLSPEGGIGLVWNDYDMRVPWVVELAAVREEYVPPDMPGHRSSNWKSVFVNNPDWAPLQTAVFPYVHRISREGVAERVLSSSFIATRSEDEQRAVRDDVLALLDRSPETRGRDELDLPYRTTIFWTRRKPAE